MCGQALMGQEPPPLPETTFSTAVSVVSVLASVRDKQGKVVTSLKQEDFMLAENGRPQTIQYFSRETDLPLTLGLLVDTSLSQRRVLSEEKDASFRFLDQVLRPEKDQTFVIHFDHDTELLQDLTSSRTDLRRALDDLALPTGSRPQLRRGGTSPGGGSAIQGIGTTLYDAIYLAGNELMKKQQGRKALVLLTDGVDFGSKTSLDEAIRAAQRSDTLVYSILFTDTEAYGLQKHPLIARRMEKRIGGGSVPHADGKKVLQQISRETGGGFYEVSRKESIDDIYRRIQEELRNQYSLGYVPDRGSTGNGYRRIALTTKRSGLTVQAREGYYPAGQ